MYRNRIRNRAALGAIIALALAHPLAAHNAVWTGQYDIARTSANVGETTLNVGNVNKATFGRLAMLPVTGCVVAQPLYVPGVNVPDRGVRNMVYVATTANNIYGFDADDFSLLFERNLGLPVPSAEIAGGAYYDFPNCDGIDEIGPIGVVGTPVIDVAAGAMYLVANTIDSGEPTHQHHHFIHKIDIATGAEMLSPVEITGVSQGITYDPRYHLQRPGLLLQGGSIYAAFASHTDELPYHGWMFMYDSQLRQQKVYTYSPKRSGTGIWQSGGGLAGDGSAVYVTTGNNAEGESGPDDYSDSILKIDPATLEVLYKTSFPSEANNWDWDADLDLGSSRVILAMDTPYAIAGSKYGDMFVMNRDGMNLVSRFQAAARHSVGFDWTGIYNGLAYWNRTIYVWPGGGGPSPELGGSFATDELKAYRLADDGSVTLAASGQTDGVGAGYQGANLAISANGSDPNSAIVWASTPEGNTLWLRPGHLHAYSASDLSNGIFKALWDDTDSEDPATGYNWAKFTQPLIANGRVYLPTFSGAVIVYGLVSGTSFSPTRGGAGPVGGQTPDRKR